MLSASFLFAITILYGINDLDAVVNSAGSFPLAEVYAQATGSKGATFGLLLIVFLSIMICVVGTFLTVGRIFWALARDQATPFSSFFGTVDERLSCPIPATVLAAIFTTGFGAISLGSATAFADLVGSFIILTTASYFLAIFPHLITGRKNVPKGPFWMGKYGYLINGISVVLIIFFNILFCFRKCSVDLLAFHTLFLLTTCSIWHACHSRHKPDELELGDLGRDSGGGFVLVVSLWEKKVPRPEDCGLIPRGHGLAGPRSIVIEQQFHFFVCIFVSSFSPC